MAACRMKEAFHHQPVFLVEAIENLLLSPDGLYVDATFGRGSHAQAILNLLSPNGRLIALDKDLDAFHYAQEYFNDPRFKIFHASFSDMKIILQQEGCWEKVQGVLFDLGVSSPQLEDPSRGFSFTRDGPLDMRMDNSRGVSAKEWVNTVDEKTLSFVLLQYGEERFARRVAKAIIRERTLKPISTTKELAHIIVQALPAASKGIKGKHPATRSFQAIRIFINQELTELESGLQQAFDALAVKGRLAVISFHSLEDRIVKRFIQSYEKNVSIPRDLPIRANVFSPRLKMIGKATKPSMKEIQLNPRARSAILRVAEKQS